MARSSMYDPELTQVISQYGWNPTAVHPVGSIYQVVEPDGTAYALKRTKKSKEKLLLLHQFLEQTREAGCQHILPWIQTLAGEAVVTTDSRNWYATPWIDTKEKQTLTPSQLIRSLGIFHRLAEPVVQPYIKLANHVTEKLPRGWRGKKEEIFQLVEQEERGFLSPFEKNLIKNRKQLEQTFHFAISGMEKFLEHESGKAPRYTLCHRRLHSSNILPGDEGFYWIDFDHAQVNTPVRDVAMFFHRLVSDQGDVEEHARLLQEYEQENPLLPKEKRLLAVYLAYPERLVKIVKAYMHEPKLSYESTYVRQLDKVFRQIDVLQEWSKELWVTKVRKQVQQAATRPKKGKYKR
ncbi:phosphotransferase [Thermoflavimicrobium dichotomicum]|uniref:Spore coat protein YsxE n=1 Tax=Thermoflavimicrobium dichotomicum TaxID=46223 RepID=A0A1I3R844_9BACL|nr:phosphotransferase [Thermoflavimicrobium dichotomicum]SFJ42285.1 spore coat protein YsxE [Thermoflavimicrobium dichotomicum]